VAARDAELQTRQHQLDEVRASAPTFFNVKVSSIYMLKFQAYES
jgi:hypothetical protein